MLVNLLAGTGLFLSAKVPTPWHTGSLFLLAIGLNCGPAYREGLTDIRNEPEIKTKTAWMRKAGFYCLCGGYLLLVLKHKRL